MKATARALTTTIALLLSTFRPSLADEPPSLVARTGDRCVTVHWNGYGLDRQWHVSRSDKADGSFVELTGSPPRTASIADLSVENGKTYFYRITRENQMIGPIPATPNAFKDDSEFLDFLEITAFDYFWYEASPQTGLIRDRSASGVPCSIAAVGFGLTGIGIGVDHGWITREQGTERTVRTLRTLAHAPQGSGTDKAGYKGWFYHFLNTDSARRYRQCELSSIDTALLLAGALYTKEYFTANNPVEQEIRTLARELFDRLDWKWMLNSGDTLTMGWHPESGFIKSRWKGYNEASILYLLGLGATGSNAVLEPKHWQTWTSTYNWDMSYGMSFVHFAPLFGHQYSACWIDFRDIQDDYMRTKGITYFENSCRATLAQRQYAIANPKHFRGYDANVWGFTACDGPQRDGVTGYAARGMPPLELDDGTIAPTAAGGSLPFAPQQCITSLRTMYDKYHAKILCGYGFRDAFNVPVDWWDMDALGIDQGAILLMAENLRSSKVWEVMKRSEILNRGLQRAGFRAIKGTGRDPATPSGHQ